MQRTTAPRLCARFFSQQTDRWKRLIQDGLPATLAAILLIFCGMPKPPITLESAPASSLQLLIEVDNQYAPTPGVTIKASFAQSSIQPIILSGKQRFECDGASFPQTEKPQVTVPRQPPGGAYSCLYTDEQGKRTNVSIAVPQGAIAITSPTAGASIPIPPSTLPSGTPLPPPNPYAPGSPNLLTIRYTLPILPPKARVIVSGIANCGINHACGETYGPTEDATADGSYLIGGTGDRPGFSQFIPGPGSIELLTYWSWLPPAGGFYSIDVAYKDTLTIPITWTKG